MFAYDALGRRIEKKDLVDPNNTRRYYYNYNLPQFVVGRGWQSLCQYDANGAIKEIFVYGNYIDEVVYIYNFNPSSDYWYVHDHLYSPAALANSSGTVLERYEYDAYGNPYILDTQYAPRTTSYYGNPYLFTGLRVDILDSGSLKIQYNRNRYYDYYTERWLTHDPLGITPNPQKPNKFGVIGQYKHEGNLYVYVRNGPIRNADAYGLFIGDKDPWGALLCGRCGGKLPLSEFDKLEKQVKDDFDAAYAADPDVKDRICGFGGILGGKGWDWMGVHEVDKWTPECCGTWNCATTIEINGKCYDADEINYYLWGLANRLICKYDRWKTLAWVAVWAVGRPDRAHCKVRWAAAGWDGIPMVSGCTKDYCKTKCEWINLFSYPFLKKLHGDTYPKD